jgi:tRNA pseudouridine38-40 synthase
VQAAVEDGLTRVLGGATRVVAAGRTDAGVHAEAQVVSFSTAASIPAEGIARTLPRYLPGDVWVLDAAEVPPAFDAQRSVIRRWYRYHIWRGGTPPAEWQGRVLSTAEPLDLPAMRRACVPLLGRHDFRGVSSPPPERSSCRTVYAADWLDLAPLLIFEICADGFLTHMVRGIVGGLWWVGRGHWTAEQFATALATTDRRDGGPNAPAIGLTLTRIDY